MHVNRQHRVPNPGTKQYKGDQIYWLRMAQQRKRVVKNPTLGIIMSDKDKMFNNLTNNKRIIKLVELLHSSKNTFPNVIFDMMTKDEQREVVSLINMAGFIYKNIPDAKDIVIFENAIKNVYLYMYNSCIKYVELKNESGDIITKVDYNYSKKTIYINGDKKNVLLKIKA